MNAKVSDTKTLPWAARIPWAQPDQWQAVHRTFNRLIDRHRPRLGPAREASRTLKRRLLSLIPLLDDLAASTCSRCPDPCCAVAVPWYDFRDLLFLNLTGEPIPPAQPLNDYGGTCRYLGPRGCRIERIRRPWICTWYRCPTQTARLQNYHIHLKNRMERELRQIKAERMALETLFLRVISPSQGK